GGVQLLQVVADVRLQPRDVRSAAAALVDQLPGAAGHARPLRHGLGDPPGGPRAGSSGAPEVSAIASGTEWVVKARGAPARASSGSSASASRTASIIGSTKPGWL